MYMGYYYSRGFWWLPGDSDTSAFPAHRVSGAVPEAALIREQHVHVSLQGMLVQRAAQPRAASADVARDGPQRVEALQLVPVQHLLHVVPEHWLWN